MKNLRRVGIRWVLDLETELVLDTLLMPGVLNALQLVLDSADGLPEGL